MKIVVHLAPGPNGQKTYHEFKDVTSWRVAKSGQLEVVRAKPQSSEMMGDVVAIFATKSWIYATKE